MPSIFNVSAATSLHFAEAATGLDYAYLGRFRWGDTVTFTVAPESAPPSLPVATIGEASYFMPVQAGMHSFSLGVYLDSSWDLGTFYVICQFSGVDQGFSFDVVAGGDSGGNVISMYFYDRPEAGYVIAQLAGGLLAQGRNPHL